MKIEAKIIGLQQRPPSSFDTLNSGNSRVVSPQTITIQFWSKEGLIDITLNEQSSLYEHLSLFAAQKGKETTFVFDIGGAGVEDYFTNHIYKLRQQIIEKQNLAKDAKAEWRKVTKEMWQLSSELGFIKSKWWYKLFISLTNFKQKLVTYIKLKTH